MEEYETSIGVVLRYENNCYVVALADGRVVGIPAATSPSQENFEADAATFKAANGL